DCVVRAAEAERSHWAPSAGCEPSACPSSPYVAPIAAMMPLYAPQRHRLPLIRSRISSWVSAKLSAARSLDTWLGTPARASATIATAEQIWPGVQYPH